MENTVKNIINKFDVKGEVCEIKVIESGHINNTYRVSVKDGDEINKYTLQTINTYVFKDPVGVMENISGVTEFLKEKIRKNGGDPMRESLTVIKARDGKPYYVDEEGKYWRVYVFVDDVYTFDFVENPTQLRNAAEGFGKFQAMLADYPMDTLHETIIGFHNTKMRYEQLMDAVKRDVCGRAESVREEVKFYEDRYDLMCSLVKLTDEGLMPIRVVHSDTKANNILIDNKTDKALCVIDLDTVMPGLSVHDFGDAIRFAGNAAEEDETDLSKVYLRMDNFEAFAQGFMSQVGDSLTDIEKDNMALGALIITLEQGSRFLADHINGDVYFKIHRENHNLDRARNHIKLAKSIEENLEEMKKVVKKYC